MGVKRSSGGTEVVTTTARAGLTTTIDVTAGAIAFDRSKTVVNLLGETVERWSADADGDGALEKTTILTEYPAGGGRKVTETDPLGGTRVTETYLDGRTERVSGTAASNVSYDYGTHALQGGGLTTKTIRETADGTGGWTETEWTETYGDRVGRKIKTAHPDGEEDSHVYYAATAAAGVTAGEFGKLAARKDADEVAAPGTGSEVTYDYNAEGELETTTETLADGNGRVTVTTRSVVEFSSGSGNDPAIPDGTYRKVETEVNNIVTGTTYTSVDGYAGYRESFSRLSESGRDVPSDGSWTETSIGADGVITKNYHTDGLLKATTVWKAGSSPPATAPQDIQNVATSGFISGTSHTHDALGRVSTVTDSRTGTVTYAGVTGTGYTPSGNLLGMKDAGDRLTQYAYDALGRRTSTTLPDTGVTHTGYTDRGEVEASWGGQTYPTFRTYDQQGRLLTLRTKPTLDTNGVPTDADGSVTSWIYDSKRGWLDRKEYHDANGTDYTYTDAGRLATRTWARGVTTTYGYDQGMLESVTYSGEDPQVHTTANLAYLYDGFGRIDKVYRGTDLATLDPAELHADYGYDPNNLVLLTERLQIDSLDKTLTRTYEDGQTTGTVNLRPKGYTFADGSATWTYDEGRHKSVTDGTDTFTYGHTYEVNGAGNHQGATSGTLVESAIPFTLDGPQIDTSLEYDDTRNVLLGRTNTYPGGSGTLSDFAYGVNAIGQRDGLTTSGDAFDTTAPVWEWAYNARGELVEANDTSAANDDRAYQYDAIGNREKTAEGLLGDLPASDTYAANALNQYTTVENFTPTPVYDADGNLTDGPVPGAAGLDPGVATPSDADLVWNAENRLVKATVGSTTVTYDYDYLGRQITRTEGSTSVHYLYDGWNRIAEYNGATHLATYLWGLDLSGTPQGAGGVGGLLSIVDNGSTKRHYPSYDGNGNVSEYVSYVPDDPETTEDEEAVAIAAHFEYDPFGNLTVDTHDNATSFLYRFSTKPQDPVTGLYYYGYRWYDPVTGRWPSRDPIEEQGGINLYAFVGNDGVNRWDLLGKELVEVRGSCDDPCGDAKAKGLDNGDVGGVVCCCGEKYSCTWKGSSTGATNIQALRIIIDCIGDHEDDYHDDIDCPDDGRGVNRPPWRDGADPAEEECEAYIAGRDCIRNRRDDCNGNPHCLDDLEREEGFYQDQINRLCSGDIR
jgi:RHS repeat-associated protein